MNVRLSLFFLAIVERCRDRLIYLCGRVFQLNGYFSVVVLILVNTLHSLIDSFIHSFIP